MRSLPKPIGFGQWTPFSTGLCQHVRIRAGCIRTGDLSRPALNGVWCNSHGAPSIPDHLAGFEVVGDSGPIRVASVYTLAEQILSRTCGPQPARIRAQPSASRDKLRGKHRWVLRTCISGCPYDRRFRKSGSRELIQECTCILCAGHSREPVRSSFC